jgi:hypothetical protein
MLVTIRVPHANISEALRQIGLVSDGHYNAFNAHDNAIESSILITGKLKLNGRAFRQMQSDTAAVVEDVSLTDALLIVQHWHNSQKEEGRALEPLSDILESDYLSTFEAIEEYALDSLAKPYHKSIGIFRDATMILAYDQRPFESK